MPTGLLAVLLPAIGVIGPVVVQVAVASGFAMLAEAGLSFLGLGVQPPDASWGALLGRALPYIDTAWWLAVAPGAVITLTVLATNVLAGHRPHRRGG
ncbi:MULTISPECIES: hypothetical protein [unclassified Micromonospora]|uniref:hypothetical protein n=1 Tax=unclassified Micromonospora TaxID=2617518 RepID=UPI003A89C8CF